MQNSEKIERSDSAVGEAALAAWEMRVQTPTRPRLSIKGMNPRLLLRRVNHVDLFPLGQSAPAGGRR
jgi:hypothetical protein